MSGINRSTIATLSEILRLGNFDALVIYASTNWGKNVQHSATCFRDPNGRNITSRISKEIFQRKIQSLLPPATKLGQGYVFTGVCDSVQRGGVYPRMPCRSHDQPALYKQLQCWWVSVGEEAAYR